jgi:hypothetical protein
MAQQNSASLTLDDLKNFTYFGRWIERNFGDDIKLADLDPDHIKQAIAGIIRSPQFSAMPKEDRAQFEHAFNTLIPSLNRIKDMVSND